MGWNRAGLSEHRGERVIRKVITPLRKGLGLPFLWEWFLLEAPAFWAGDGGKHCSIKGSNVQALVNTPDKPMSCLWMFRKQKKKLN